MYDVPPEGRRVAYFDKIALRYRNALAKEKEAALRDNADSVDGRRGHPIRGSDAYLIMTVVNPTAAGLRILAEWSDSVVNYIEPALDVCVPDKLLARRLRELLDDHHLYGWHGGHDQVRLHNGTYTGQRRPGRRFGWYWDRPSKRTGDPHCLHIEGRHQGSPALRRIGICEPADLLCFDHVGYWRRNLRLFEIDPERLGRYHDNRLAGRRRRQAHVQQCGPISYNTDRSTGAVLLRALGAHARQEHRSVQRFVDQYGRGPFLREIDASALLPR